MEIHGICLEFVDLNYSYIIAPGSRLIIIGMWISNKQDHQTLKLSFIMPFLLDIFDDSRTFEYVPSTFFFSISIE